MTTPNTTGPSAEIQRYAIQACPYCVNHELFPIAKGAFVMYDDHLAALSRAREDARREALEEAVAPILASMVQCKADRENLDLVPVVEDEPDPNGCDRCDELQKIVDAIRALIHPTPQGETKEKQP